MNIYPKKYEVEENDNGGIIYFDWPASGDSLWGIWCVSKYISLTMGASKEFTVWYGMESMILLNYEGMDISVYQEGTKALMSCHFHLIQVIYLEK